MKILLSNDDGIHAPGLAALRSAVVDMGQVTVVAPAEHQSGASHAVSLSGLTARRVQVDDQAGADGFEGLAVEGSPADCVRLAILRQSPGRDEEFLDGLPDLVLSGINVGANVGIHVFYSGTVAAAAEAAMLSVPAVAFSAEVKDRATPDFTPLGRICRRILQGLLERGLRGGDLINVNIPLLGPDRPGPKGVRVVRQSRSMLRDSYELKGSGPAQTYEITGGRFQSPRHDTDVATLAEGYVTITPLHVDMTDHAKLDGMSTETWDDLPA